MTVSREVHYRKSWAGKIGAAVQRSRHDPRVYTFEARNAFLRRFLPDDPTLDEKERHLRAAAARRAYMLQLALRSAKVRAKRMAARNGARKRGQGNDG